MSHKHEHLIQSIFRDPISANIHWREVESLLHHLGAKIESLSGARLRVKLNGHEDILHRPHHGNTLDRSAVKILREYLTRARVTPASGAVATGWTPTSPGSYRWRAAVNGTADFATNFSSWVPWTVVP